MLDLATAFPDARRNGTGWTARCPAHDDRRASLSIGRGADGKWLLTCHAGCALEAILAAAHLEPRDLFPETTGHSRIVAEYRYHDEGGAHLFDVVRFAPKDFRQRRADGVWSMRGVRRVLYRLDQLQGHTTAYVVEGERDADRLWGLGLPATTNVGGAGKWKPEYVKQLQGAAVERIAVIGDNDIPGRRHAEDIARTCHAAGLTVKIVDLPDLPPKGDVSDWLAAGHTKTDLAAAVTAAPPYGVTASPRTLADVEQTFARWIRDADPVPTRAVLAAYVANRDLDGDPIWLMLVGGSGVGKTERLTPLAVMPDVVLESSITGPAALLSGTGKKERAKDATGGLLRKVPDGGGVLILKDFTSIIDMHRDSRAEVLAALREIYDGRWDRSVGADGGRTLTWTGRLGLLAGCTTAIDSAYSVVAVMGTRFLLVRLHNGPEIASSAFAHVGSEREMRAQLREAVRGLLEHLPGRPFPKEFVRDPVIALASLVALARSPVERDIQGEIRLVLDPEAPTRIVKMLVQLWRACGLLGLSQPDAWTLVHRVGMDSIPKLRRAIVTYLEASPIAPNTTEIAEAVEHPTRTTRRALEDLTAHRIARRIAGGEGKADHWELTQQARDWLSLAETLPVSSDPAVCPTPDDAVSPLSYKSTDHDQRQNWQGQVASSPHSPPDRSGTSIFADESEADPDTRKDQGDARCKKGWH